LGGSIKDNLTLKGEEIKKDSPVLKGEEIKEDCLTLKGEETEKELALPSRGRK